MDDGEVLDAFVNGGARRAFGPTLHVEGDGLFLSGYWHLALRISPDTFMVRAEEPPDGSTVPEEVIDQLTRRDLHQVGADLPAMTLISYTELTLGSTPWALWAPDAATGEAAVNARAGAESFLGEPPGPFSGLASPDAMDFSAELGGARRLAELPASVVLLVGLPDDEAAQLTAGLADTQCIKKSFEEVNPEDCEAIMPTLIAVDAGEEVAQSFVAGLRNGVYSRHLPVVAIADPGRAGPQGADLRLDRSAGATEWAEAIRSLLP